MQMSKGKLLPIILLFVVALGYADASDNYTVNHGTNQAITAHTVCSRVTNNSATNASVYVPTQTSVEWESFRTNPPAGISLGACSLNIWTRVANLPLARQTSGALLGNGRVLICGGDVGNSYSNRCDIYNPATNSFSAGASLPQVKNLYDAMKSLPDGRVLACAGLLSTSSFTNRCDVYNPTTNAWTQVASLPQSKYGTAAAPLGNGRIIFCGGATSASNIFNRCDIYNPATNSFSQAANNPLARVYMGGTMLSDGRALFCGGTTGSVSRRCDIYNPTTNAWTRVADMSRTRNQPRLATLDDGRVLICGGGTFSCEIYNPATNTTAAAASAPESKSGPAMVTLDDGRVLLCGGRNSSDDSNRCDIYTP